MDFLVQPDFWVRWLQVVLIDLVLAGDNALVIALAVRRLPPRQQLWGRVWGSLGAVLLRVLFIAMVTFLLRIPLLQIIGGLVLVWIAIKLVKPTSEAAEEVRVGTSLRDAIWIIIVADVAMSLDNVLAIAAVAKGDLVLVIFGLLLSLPLVVWGSGLLATLMNRFRWIVWLGGGVLCYVAVEMILKDPWVIAQMGDSFDLVHRILPLAAGVLLAIYGWLLARRADSGRAASTDALANR
jgi:YjbE family integral membrane protein